MNSYLGHVISLLPIPLFKRLFWLLMLTACCFGSASVLRASLTLYRTQAVSYSVETNYLEWDTPFPAVTICENQEADRVKNYLSQHNISLSLTNFYKEVSYFGVKYCKTCTTCKINHTCVNDFVDTVNEIRTTCKELLSECWWNDKSFSCCDRFHPIQAEYGICFVFNSRFTGNKSVSTVNRRVGLSTLSFTVQKAITIKVHSPNDLISVASENIIGAKCSTLPLYSDFEAIFNAEQITSDVSVLSISPASRDCLYSHELLGYPLWPFPTYSYGSCVLYCRAMAQIEKCNCTHHFMPKISNTPACDVQGLACITNRKDEFANTKCVCPMDCEDVIYKASHVHCYRYVGSSMTPEIKVRGTFGRIRLGQLPSLRVKRQAFRDLLGLVVDIGGVIGVFFGASILSFIEIIYIFCIRSDR